jgi:hypothetical protein
VKPHLLLLKATRASLVLATTPAGAAALTSGRRAHREKPAGSGRNFEPGQNSRDGTVFQRGPDMLPRGNATLMLRIAFHDERVRWFRQLQRIIRKGSDAAFLKLNEVYLDRTEGRPGRKGTPVTAHRSKFVFTARDGQEVVREPRRDEAVRLERAHLVLPLLELRLQAAVHCRHEHISGDGQDDLRRARGAGPPGAPLTCRTVVE